MTNAFAPMVVTRAALAIAGGVALIVAKAFLGTPSGEAPFVLDGNRVYAEVGFVRGDGSVHRALAFVDTGTQFLDVRKALYDELQVQRGRSLSFRVGQLAIEVPGADVTREDREPLSVGSHLKVEATLPASVLQHYRVVIDYRARTLALEPPGTPAAVPEGVAVPIRVKVTTGLAVVDAAIDGRTYPVTIDIGSAYTWVRQRTGSEWLRTHPAWSAASAPSARAT